MKVFISHKWEDSIRDNWVIKLGTDLIQQYNIDCLLDLFEPVDTIAGFMQKMKDCDVVLFIMTPNCVRDIELNNSNIFYEASLAITQYNKKKLRIIPILREGTEVATIFSPYKHIDFRLDYDYPTKLKELSNAIFRKTTKPESIHIYVAKNGHLIHKLKAKDTTGRWAYYFVLVEPEMERSFMAAIEGDGTIDLEDYGKVVASCYGEAPTKDVKDYLKQRYGFNV